MPRAGQRPLCCSLLATAGVTVSREKPEGNVGIAHPPQWGSTQTGVGLASHRVHRAAAERWLLCASKRSPEPRPPSGCLTKLSPWEVVAVPGSVMAQSLLPGAWEA